MIAGPIETDASLRGVIRTYFYPICLIQDFRGRLDNGFPEYLCDCDTFHADIMRERYQWMKAHDIKYQINHDVYKEQEDILVSKVFRLYVEFARQQDAVLYKLRWA